MTTPTDVELMKAAVQHSHELYKLPTSRAAFQAGALFASQTLAKWGTPASVGVEPVAWAATSEDGDVEALGMNQSRRFDTPLYTAAQVLAMGRVPLTEQAIDAMWRDHWDGFVSFAEAEVIVRATEEAHDIKQGGQHGADI